MAYVVGSGLEQFRWERWGLPEDAPVPKATHEPARIGQPSESRFFRQSDELWDVTPDLRGAMILRSEKSWAVFNATSERLVLHAGKEDHNRLMLALDWGKLAPSELRLVKLRVALLTVKCPELGRVAWTGEEVQERAPEELVAIRCEGALQKLKNRVKVGERVAVLESEMTAWEGAIELKLSFETWLKAEDGKSRKRSGIEWSSHMLIQSGRTFYVELGSTDDPAHTHLLALTGEVQFENGTPTWRWKEFENPAHELPLVERYDQVKDWRPDWSREDGFSYEKWKVSPAFVKDLELGLKTHEVKRAKVRGPLPWMFPLHKLEEYSEQIRNVGVEIPESGWVYYDPKNSELYAKLDAENMDLLDSFVSSIRWTYGLATSMCVFTLVSCEGGNPKRGTIPPGAKRLARLVAWSRAPIPCAVRIGTEKKHRLLSGARLIAELGEALGGIAPRFSFEHRGESGVLYKGALELSDGAPRFVPLGKAGGISLGLVMEAARISERGELQKRN